MGAIQGFGGWYDSWVGSGVYMHVLAAGGVYRPFYVGKSVDIGRRWREHVVEYLAPKDGFWAPENAGDFLADPIGVMNGRGYAPGLANRGRKPCRPYLRRLGSASPKWKTLDMGFAWTTSSTSFKKESSVTGTSKSKAT